MQHQNSTLMMSFTILRGERNAPAIVIGPHIQTWVLKEIVYC
jgi:hypothetical protein